MTGDHNSPTSHKGHTTPQAVQNALINLGYVALRLDVAASGSRGASINLYTAVHDCLRGPMWCHSKAGDGLPILVACVP